MFVARTSNSVKPVKGGLRLIRREQQNEISRTHILDAAEQVFADKGLNATIKEIAELADFSVGAVYGFFEGKDELLAAVFERHARAFLGSMREAAWEPGRSRDKLHRLFDIQFEYFRGHPNFYKLFDRLVRSRSWALQFTSAEQSSIWYRESLEIMTKLFRDGIADGELVEGDPVVLSAIFSGIATAYISHWIYEVASKGNARIERIAPVARLHELLDRAFVRKP